METNRNSGASTCEQPRKIENLPEEIITGILAWLPVKSLLKFRCVSKPWHSLISSQHFIKSHLKNSIDCPQIENHKIIATTTKPNHCLKHCSVRSLLYEPVTHGVRSYYPMSNEQHSVRVVGTCNGLICIMINRKDYFLWNPCTREAKKLPDINDEFKKYLYLVNGGFGFDESSNDYKVLVFYYFDNNGEMGYKANTYSLRSNSWKEVGNVAAVPPFIESGKLVSGKYHWVSFVGVGSTSRWDILSFDLESEVSGMVDPPTYMEGELYLKLGVLGGCLCVLFDYPESRAEVWVLKQYGVKESWDKIVSVPYCGDPWNRTPNMPLFVAPSGEILVTCGPTFKIYDPKDNAFRHPQTIDFGEYFEADVYVESLVSPFSDGEKPEHCSER